MPESRVLEKPVDEGLIRKGTAPVKARVVLLQTQAEAAGAQEISRILSHGLTERGYDVHHVFCFRRTGAFDGEKNAVFCASERPHSLRGVGRMFTTLMSHLRDLRPDVLICFQHYGNLIGTLAARRAGIKAVIVNRNSSQELIPSWLKAVDLGLGLAGWFQHVVVNSGPIEREYRSYPARYRAALVRIDHAFDAKLSVLSRSAARERFKLPVDGVLLGSVARLHATKNLETAIRVLPGRDWHLALAGQGPAEEELVAAARAADVLDRVHFVGELRPAMVGDFLRALDVFVFPSTAETFGLAAVEAAQAGIPVVANELDVLREVLSFEGKPCAQFVNANDPSAFAEAVERFLRDEQLTCSMTMRAKNLSTRYSVEQMVGSYARLIDAAIFESRCR